MARLRRRTRDPEGRMSLADHFREARNRFVIALLGVVACAVLGWIYYDPILGLILDPVSDLRNDDDELLVQVNFLSNLTQPFSTQLRVSMFTGVVLASPIWLWQIWAFLLPGLRPREKRTALWFFLASVPLFFAGAALAAYSLPRTVGVLVSFLPEAAGGGIADGAAYLNFVLYFIVAFGLAFLLPVFMVLANSLRVFPVRAMISGWRIALLTILIFSALATPDSSGWTMFVLTTPMFGLYWLAVGVSYLNERRRRKNDPDWIGTADDEASEL